MICNICLADVTVPNMFENVLACDKCAVDIRNEVANPRILKPE
jgi:hypothetical protein